MDKEKICYFIFLLCTAGYAISFNSYQTFLLFLAVLLFPILLWGNARIMKKKLVISFLNSNHIVQKGSPFVQKLFIKNSFFLPVPKISITFSVFHQFGGKSREETLLATVPAKGECSVALQMCCEYCGLIWIKMNEVFLYDVFGIFKLRIAPLEPISIAILPNLYQIPKLVLQDSYGDMTEAAIESRAGDDLSEVFGYREYSHGDKLNRIDWKLSAKQGQIVVKEYSALKNEWVLLLFDSLSTRKEDRLYEMDAAIDLLYTISYTLLCQQKKIIISWYDQMRDECRMDRVTSEDALYSVLLELYKIPVFLESVQLFDILCANANTARVTDTFYLGYRREDTVVNCLRETQSSSILHMMLLMREMPNQEKNLFYQEKGIFVHRIAITDLKNELLSLKEEWGYEDRSLNT